VSSHPKNGANSEPAEGVRFASAPVEFRARRSLVTELPLSPAPDKDDTMTSHSARSATRHLQDMHADESLLVNGTLPAAILVGLGLGLAILGLSMASIWQWLSH
jgi:hypothetical protein